MVKIAATTPKRPLYHVVDYKGREDIITAEGFLKRTRRVAYLLDKKGVVPGDHILLATPLCSEQVIVSHDGCRGRHSCLSS
jgi:acyl-CoA synthetase (AMP-forming)/AMP-acid ligase II